jgi:hypothetical protein
LPRIHFTKKNFRFLCRTSALLRLSHAITSLKKSSASFAELPHFYALSTQHFTKKIRAPFAELPHFYALSTQHFTKKIRAPFAELPHSYALSRNHFTKKNLPLPLPKFPHFFPP